VPIDVVDARVAKSLEHFLDRPAAADDAGGATARIFVVRIE
jgi:hypothetical protein